MRFFQLAATAAMLLHMGTFVHANPMFADHNNAALDSSAECKGTSFLYLYFLYSYSSLEIFFVIDLELYYII